MLNPCQSTTTWNIAPDILAAMLSPYFNMVITILAYKHDFHYSNFFAVQACPIHLHFETGTYDRHFSDDIFKCIFVDRNVLISLKISLKFVSNVRINNITALVQILTWCRLGDKPLSEPMVVRFPMPICVTRPQWVRSTNYVHWNTHTRQFQNKIYRW